MPSPVRHNISTDEFFCSPYTFLFPVLILLQRAAFQSKMKSEKTYHAFLCLNEIYCPSPDPDGFNIEKLITINEVTLLSSFLVFR